MANEFDFQKILDMIPEEKRAEFFSNIMNMATPESVSKVASMVGIKLTDEEAAAWLQKIQGMKESMGAEGGNLISGLMSAFAAKSGDGKAEGGDSKGGLLDGLLSAVTSSGEGGGEGGNADVLDKLKKAFLS